MIVRTFTPNKDDSFRTAGHNRTDGVRTYEVIFLSKGYDACSKDIRSMCDKLSRLLAVVREWSNDESPAIALALDKALEETIKRIQSDVDFSLRAYRIEDEDEKLNLTKVITELINQAKAIING